MKYIGPAVRMLLFFTVLTGLIYPVVITGFAHFLYPFKSEGQLLKKNGMVIGSAILAQKFVAARYFWGRPSSGDDNALSSGGSNLGPTSAALKKSVVERAQWISQNNGLTETSLIPQDLLFASGSGLDPDISVEAALFQVQRIARIRHIENSQITKLINEHIMQPDLGFLGEPRVNVLELNLALDESGPKP